MATVLSQLSSFLIACRVKNKTVSKSSYIIFENLKFNFFIIILVSFAKNGIVSHLPKRHFSFLIQRRHLSTASKPADS